MHQADEAVSQQSVNASGANGSGRPTDNAGCNLRPLLSKINNTVLNDILCNPEISDAGDKLLTATMRIVRFKSSSNKIKNVISSILEEGDGSRIGDLWSLQRAYERAHSKCTEAIRAFCMVLEDGSPRLLDNHEQLRNLDNDYTDMRERINQCLLNFAEIAPITRNS